MIRMKNMRLQVKAGWNEDKLREYQRLLRVTDREVCAPVLPALPPTSCKVQDFSAMGVPRGVDPFPVTVQLDSRPPKNSRLRLVADDSTIAKRALIVLEKRDGVWRHYGFERQWYSEPGHRSTWHLGLVAFSFAHPFELTVELLSSEGEALARKSLRGISSPFLLTSSLDRVDCALIIENELTKTCVRSLKSLLQRMNAEVEAIPFSEVKHDVWMQDTVEIGCAPFLKAKDIGQAVAVLSGIRSPHEQVNTTPLDLRIKRHFEERKAVVIEAGAPRANTRWIDWYGNLEVSPPTRDSSGRRFPFGRILTGKQKELSLHPDVMAFLEAQGLQVPALILDTSWLTIGHIDEMVQFAPAEDPPGFRILIPGPKRAKSLLESLIAQGHAKARLFQGREAETSVQDFLEEVACSEEQQHIEESLRETRAKLCEGLGIQPEQILELPVLFRNGLAAIPNPVNGLMINGHYIAPDPECLRIDGKDPFKEAIQAALASCGVKTRFISVWEPYHVRGGELHCGTNAIRKLDFKRSSRFV